jgi:hypothetical protein
MGEYRIMADEDRLFYFGLGDEQSVKWIFMMFRQVLQRQYMLEIDRQYLEVVGLSLTGYYLSQRQAQIKFAEVKFNLYFPGADYTEQHHVCPVLARCPRLRGELGRVTIPPDEGMRIQ